MSNTKKHSILVAGTDETTLNCLSGLADQYAISQATSGAEALDFIDQHDVDLLLSDLGLGDMTAHCLLERIKGSDKSYLPVILLSTADNEEDESKAFELGAADYIKKPIRLPVLKTRMRKQLELLEYKRSLEQLVQEQVHEITKSYEELNFNQNTVFELLAYATDYRDSCTGGHIARTSFIVKIIIEELERMDIEGYRISKAEMENIVKSSKLHDIGKIGIPDAVLMKPGKLTPEEFDVIKSHTLKAENIIGKYITDGNASSAFLKTARDIAKFHHEKWNGKGYPDSLYATDIPLSARIMAIADVYDALVSIRPYKDPVPHDKVMEIITKDAGSHFDPIIVEAFINASKKLA